MRRRVVPFFSAVTLACWVASAGFGQLARLHVETDHHEHEHAEPHGPTLLGLHGADPAAHEHRLEQARGTAVASVRAPMLAPLLAVRPLESACEPPQRMHHAPPIPLSRGSPQHLQHHTILLI